MLAFRNMTVGIAGVSGLARAAGALAQTAPGAPVPTAQGLVRGFVKDGVQTFLGVPYAAPLTSATNLTTFGKSRSSPASGRGIGERAMPHFILLPRAGEG